MQHQAHTRNHTARGTTIASGQLTYTSVSFPLPLAPREDETEAPARLLDEPLEVRFGASGVVDALVDMEPRLPAPGGGDEAGGAGDCTRALREVAADDPDDNDDDEAPDMPPISTAPPALPLPVGSASEELPNACSTEP